MQMIVLTNRLFNAAFLNLSSVNWVCDVMYTQSNAT